MAKSPFCLPLDNKISLYAVFAVALSFALGWSSKVAVSRQSSPPPPRLDGNGSDALDRQYARWLASFKAADPTYTQFCRTALSQAVGKAQWGQDMFVFFNLFKFWPMAGKKGFYVDSGANEAETDSNTFFFDKCLGWEGVCVEPQAMYHSGIQKNRSCTLVKKCLASAAGTAAMSGSGQRAAAVVGKDGSSASGLQCETLESILAGVGRDQNSIDFWSLDIEGHEIPVLNSINFSKLFVRALLIEDFWLPARELDHILTIQSGFVKYAQLAVDSLYVPRGLQTAMPWYPKRLDSHWDEMTKWRRQSDVAPLLKC